MTAIRFSLQQPLLDLFDRLRAVTMPEMKAALGTEVDVTVFRKLPALDYQTSYSHRGAFYTLQSIPRFDAQGLWCSRRAWFSRQGTLLNTAAALVNAAPAGYWVGELEDVLHVPVKDPLRQLGPSGSVASSGVARTVSLLGQCCSIDCWTNGSDVCMPGWRVADGVVEVHIVPLPVILSIETATS